MKKDGSIYIKLFLNSSFSSFSLNCRTLLMCWTYDVIQRKNSYQQCLRTDLAQYLNSIKANSLCKIATNKFGNFVCSSLEYISPDKFLHVFGPFADILILRCCQWTRRCCRSFVSGLVSFVGKFSSAWKNFRPAQTYTTTKGKVMEYFCIVLSPEYSRHAMINTNRTIGFMCLLYIWQRSLCRRGNRGLYANAPSCSNITGNSPAKPALKYYGGHCFLT
jgi:hypothetical protein